MYKGTLTVSIIVWVALLSAKADILPTNRMFNWSSSGVRGGVPNSSNFPIYTNFTSSATVAQVNAGLSAAEAAYNSSGTQQVVQLGSGTFTFTTTLANDHNGVILRGNGMTNTWIVMTDGIIRIRHGGRVAGGINGSYDGGASVSWTAGYTQGTTNITLSSVTGLTVGRVVVLDQLNDNYYVNDLGFEGERDSGRGSGSSSRELQQWARVQAINGNVVTIWPPVQLDIWSSGLTPEVWWLGATSLYHDSAFENFGVDGTLCGGGGGVENPIIQFEDTDNCWIKGVMTSNTPGSHVTWYGTFNCTYQDSYEYWNQSHYSRSYGWCAFYANNSLIQNNRYYAVPAPHLMQECSSMNVIGYCYTTNNYYDDGGPDRYLAASLQPHAAHTWGTLFEGNHGTLVSGDFIHGSHSHNVIYRNRLRGFEQQSAAGGGDVNKTRICILLAPTNRAYSVVGNILGTSGVQTNYESYPGNVHGEPVIYEMGFVNHAYDGHTPDTTSWADDADVRNTLFRTLNYDVANNAIVYATNASTVLSNSLYLTSKPAFFGSLAWPPFNPSNTTAAATSMTNIPAGYRAVFGVDPPADGSDTNAPTITITSPTNGVYFATTFYYLTNLSGTASDDIGISSMTWTNSGHALSGTPSGSTSWSVSSNNLALGTNSFIVTAYDAAANSSNDTLTVFFTDTNAPTVAITSHTNGQQVASSFSVTGTAADYLLSSVSLTNLTTSTGYTVSGTTSWSATATAATGTNVLEAVAVDTSGNKATNDVSVYLPAAGGGGGTILRAQNLRISR